MQMYRQGKRSRRGLSLWHHAGILVMVFCRREFAPHVGEVATTSVACGLMGVAGNKGAAAISLTLFRRSGGRECLLVFRRGGGEHSCQCM